MDRFSPCRFEVSGRIPHSGPSEGHDYMGHRPRAEELERVGPYSWGSSVIEAGTLIGGLSSFGLRIGGETSTFLRAIVTEGEKGRQGRL
ncbi:hypothetical protein ACLOJK_021932 [Asimina triloba]